MDEVGIKIGEKDYSFPVIVGTEGEKAIDVFHITRAGAKLTAAEQHELSAALSRMLEATDETD